MPRWLLEYADVCIAIKAECTRAENLLSKALHGLGLGKSDITCDIEISLSRIETHWVLEDHTDGSQKKLSHEGDAIYHLTDRLVFHIADKTKRDVCLHAAAVGSNDKALVIPADSGSGKSSFTAWLVHQGFTYITDELVVMTSNASLTGIARPIQIKPTGLSAVEPLLVEPSDVFKGRIANAVTIGSLGGEFAQGEHALSAFIFPKYSANSCFSFKQISSADAGMRIMANNVNARNLEGHGFRAMMALIRNTPCYALDYGGFHRLPADFTVTLKALMSG